MFITKRQLRRDHSVLRQAYDLDQEEHANEQSRLSGQISRLMKRDRELCEQISALRSHNELLRGKMSSIQMLSKDS